MVKDGRPSGEPEVGWSVECDKLIPSVLWHCWSGNGKGIRPVKLFVRWGVGGDDLDPCL